MGCGKAQNLELTMNEYNPDTWVVLKFTTPDYTLHKVLAGFYGGFAQGDWWKLNSGITKVELDGNFYLFHGSSGSVYRCHKGDYRTSSITARVLDSLEYQINHTENKVEMLPKETNWFEVDFQ